MPRSDLQVRSQQAREERLNPIAQHGSRLQGELLARIPLAHSQNEYAHRFDYDRRSSSRSGILLRILRRLLKLVGVYAAMIGKAARIMANVLPVNAEGVNIAFEALIHLVACIIFQLAINEAVNRFAALGLSVLTLSALLSNPSAIAIFVGVVALVLLCDMIMSCTQRGAFLLETVFARRSRHTENGTHNNQQQGRDTSDGRFPVTNNVRGL